MTAALKVNSQNSTELSTNLGGFSGRRSQRSGLCKRIGLDVATTAKKVVNFFGKEKCTPEKILAQCMRKWPRLTLVRGPEWLIRPWTLKENNSNC